VGGSRYSIQIVEGLHVINKKGSSTEEGILGGWEVLPNTKEKTPSSAFRV
jgi:hypothetical protein